MGQELFPYLIVLLVIVLAGEQVLSNRFYQDYDTGVQADRGRRSWLAARRLESQRPRDVPVAASMSEWYFNPVGGYGLTSAVAMALVLLLTFLGLPRHRADAAAPRRAVRPAAGRDRAGDDGHAAAGAGHTKTKQQSATLVVLVDRSRSMTVADAVGGKTRWELLRTAVDEARRTLDKIGEDLEVSVYTFDSRAASARFLRWQARPGQQCLTASKRPSARRSKTCCAARRASGWPA